jgi:hypothetical protein
MLRKRKLVQAAKGAQRWVPWQEEPDAAVVVRNAKAAGSWIAVVELTAESVPVMAMQPRYPAVLVLGGELSGVSQDVLACADQAHGQGAAAGEKPEPLARRLKRGGKVEKMKTLKTSGPRLGPRAESSLDRD